MNIIEVKTDNQIKKVTELARIIWNEHYVPIIGQAQVDYMLERFQSFSSIKNSAKEGYVYYLFNEDNGDFGYMAIQLGHTKVFLSKWYILKELRGKGYGKEAFDFVDTYCKDRGFDTVWLTCNKNNETGLKVYSRLGFKIVDEVKTDIGCGYVMDDYILEKSLIN